MAHRSDVTPLRTLLLDGEKLLWDGRPVVLDFCLRGSLLFVPFSLLWCGFAIFWEASVLNEHADTFFALWGVPFVLLGLYMVAGRFVVAYVEARHTFYAVTDQRVLIVGGVLGRRVTSLSLTDLGPVRLEQGRSGTGTITFGGGAPLGFRFPAGRPVAGATAGPPALVAIPGAASVYGLLDRARISVERP